MYFVLYRMYFHKNTVSKHKNASIKIIKSFILPFVVCILHSKWTHANCSTAKQIISIFYAVKPDRYAVQLVSSRTSERETLVRFPALPFIYIKCARVTKYIWPHVWPDIPTGALPMERSIGNQYIPIYAVYEYLWALSIRSQTSTFTLQHIFFD